MMMHTTPRAQTPPRSPDKNPSGQARSQIGPPYNEREAMTIATRATLALAALLALSAAACFTPEFRRECQANRDCPEGQECRFSNCVIPEPEAERCAIGQIRCDGLCIDPSTDLTFCGGCGGCDDLDGAHAVACVGGICQFQCLAGFRDIDGDLQSINANGCECDTSTPEVCDGLDNDCDDNIDDDDLDLDLSTCPPLPGAAPVACADTGCRYACLDGASDANGDLAQDDSDGCECQGNPDQCQCQPTDPPTEVCDGRDNDCDDLTDADDPDLIPSDEVCDGLDNDCDGLIDADDPDLPPADELCDGRDNDCDGLTDADDPDLTPELCALQQGACQGATALCQQGRFLDCDEGQYLNNDATFTGLDDTLELICDDLDNNCDGVTDELCCPSAQGTFALATPQDVDGEQFLPALALSADNALILAAWQEANLSDPRLPNPTGTIAWQLITPQGALQGSPGAIDTEGSEDLQPTVAFTGQSFAMVHVRKGGRESDALMRTNIGLDGQIVDQPVEIASVIPDLRSFRDPVLAEIGGGRLLLVWSQGIACLNIEALSCIRAATIAPDGQIETFEEYSEPVGVIQARSPSIVLNGAARLIAWHDLGPASTGIKRRALDAQLRATGSIQFIPNGTIDLTLLPDMVASGEGAILAFSALLGNTLQVKTARLNASGGLVGSLITVTQSPGDKISPRLARLGEGAGLLWVQGQSVQFLRLNEDGEAVGQPRALIEDRKLGFEPFAARGLGGDLFALVRAEGATGQPERVRMSLQNAEGEPICLP